jgi:hypothetical protein
MMITIIIKVWRLALSLEIKYNFVTYDAEGEAEKYSDYLLTVQKMIDSLNITTSDN